MSDYACARCGASWGHYGHCPVLNYGRTADDEPMFAQLPREYQEVDAEAARYYRGALHTARAQAAVTPKTFEERLSLEDLKYLYMFGIKLEEEKNG